MLSEIKGSDWLELTDPIDAEFATTSLSEPGLVLPVSHQQLLALSNGLPGFGGYYRLFGVGPGKRTNALWWNESDTWKFAWDDDLGNFFCFGGTAWGDQYAYRYDELKTGTDPNVYFLEGVTMSAEPLASTFDDFLRDEFLVASRKPYDVFLLEARRRLGDIVDGENITYIPSLLLTGEEDPENIAKMQATASMIVNGDLARQLANEDQSREVAELRPYSDDKGRERLQVVWAD